MATIIEFKYQFEVKWDKELGKYRVWDTENGIYMPLSYQYYTDARRARDNYEFTETAE